MQNNVNKFRKRLSVALALGLLTGVLLISYISLRRIIGRPRETPAAQVTRLQDARTVLFEQLGGYAVTIPSTDGVTLAGVVVERPHAKGTVILCHGFRGDKERMVRFLPLFTQYNLVLFDFRSSGESSGDYSSIGCHEWQDVACVIEFVKQHSTLRTVKHRIIFGTSMGAAAAIKAAAMQEDLACALILDSPYACLREEIAHVFCMFSGLPYYPFFPVMMRMFTRFWQVEDLDMRPEEYIKKIAVPVLFIHSASDDFTLPHHSVRLYALAGEKNRHARLWIGPPARHTKLYETHTAAYAAKIERFLNKIVLPAAISS